MDANVRVFPGRITRGRKIYRECGGTILWLGAGTDEKRKWRASEMAQRVQVFAANPEDLNYTSESHGVGENQLLPTVL